MINQCPHCGMEMQDLGDENRCLYCGYKTKNKKSLINFIIIFTIICLLYHIM